MRAEILADLLRQMADQVESGADVLFQAASVIERDQRRLGMLADILGKAQLVLPLPEPTR